MNASAAYTFAAHSATSEDMDMAKAILDSLHGYDPCDEVDAISDWFFLATLLRNEREKGKHEEE